MIVPTAYQSYNYQFALNTTWKIQATTILSENEYEKGVTGMILTLLPTQTAQLLGTSSQ